VLRQFHLRPGTGGKGDYCGGDGVIREYLWRKNLTLSVLTERRVFSPYGLNGNKKKLIYKLKIQQCCRKQTFENVTLL